MRYILPTIIMMLSLNGIKGQNLQQANEGKVSYTTTQNVYVKFQSTSDITAGDTLFVNSDGKLVPALVVKEISSISCVCIPLPPRKLSVGDAVVFKQKATANVKPVETVPAAAVPGIANTQDSIKPATANPKPRTQIVSGNLSVASYLNFSNAASNTERMKYTFAMAIQNIGGSKFSVETYITFAHKLGKWSEIQDDIFNGLKIYSLAFNYQLNQKNSFWLGRKINPRISNVGAIDGLQYELRAGSFTVGLFGGTRPDYTNYSFDPHLVQFGGYFGHDLAGKNGSMQTTLAFVDQLNQGMTDRRFAYLQHTNSLARNLYFFGSVEVDLYKKTMNQVDTAVSRDTSYTQNYSPTLSNLYLSLRYRPIRKLSLSISYSARQNVIYYESYKSLVDRMLEAATVQGFIFQVSYQPVNMLSLGVNAGYRDSKSDPRPTKNLYGYVTYARIPGVNVSATLSGTYLETSYMSGSIYSLGFSREIVPGKLSGEAGYRYVSYKFYSGEANMVQNMAEVNLMWRIMKKLSCGLYYEGTFDANSIFNRIYFNITQRF